MFVTQSDFHFKEPVVQKYSIVPITDKISSEFVRSLKARNFVLYFWVNSTNN